MVGLSTALGIVFVAGLIFLLLMFFGLREAILHSLSPSLRSAVAVGIGMFIAFIGLQNGGLVADAPALVTLNVAHFRSIGGAVFWTGLIVTLILMTRQIPAAILIGIVCATIVASVGGKLEYHGILDFPTVREPAAFAFNLSHVFSMACLPFSPLIMMIGTYPPITAPALVFVGAMMFRNAESIDWSDETESIPAFMIILGIPLFFSIADGIALGFVVWALLKLAHGRFNRATWRMCVLAAVIVIYFLAIRVQM
jgi:xanthine/uracil/vitamin C permease (AzgA family)